MEHNNIENLFEPLAHTVEFVPHSREHASNLVAKKLSYLKGQGTITIQQVELVIELLPHCNIEDMLIFYAGYQGLITQTIWDK